MSLPDGLRTVWADFTAAASAETLGLAASGPLR
jgi:hypothetical protein